MGLLDFITRRMLARAIRRDMKENPEFWQQVHEGLGVRDRLPKELEEAARKEIKRSKGRRQG